MGEAVSDAVKQAAESIAGIAPTLHLKERLPVPCVSGDDMCKSWAGLNPERLQQPILPPLSSWCPVAFLPAFGKEDIDIVEQQQDQDAQRFDDELSAARTLLQLGGEAGGSKDRSVFSLPL